MNNLTKILMAFVVMLSLTNVSATTSGSKRITDPIDGSKCRVSVVVSYGSYIYRAPSKYDQVFFPQTSRTGIWHCPKSGFTSLINDAKITEKEKVEITLYLEKNYKGLDFKTRPKTLDLLKDIYEIRNTTSIFDNKLLRILANHYNGVEGDEYRKLAYEHALNILNKEIDNLTLKQTAEYFYLVAHYSKKFGSEEEKEAYSKMFDSIVIDKLVNNENLKNQDIYAYAFYLKKLLDDRKDTK